jgi:hypothetical protein
VKNRRGGIKLKNAIGLLIALTLVFAGCSSDLPVDSSNKKTEEKAAEKREAIKAENETKQNESQEEETKDNGETTSSKEATKVGDVVETEGGKFTLVSLSEVEQNIKSGPMNVTIPSVKVVHTVAEGQLKDMVGKDEFAYVSVNMVVENSSEDTISYYPDQAKLVTNTGEQIDMPEMFLSDDLGGDFYGKVVKDGSIMFILEKSKAEDIKWIRLIIGGASDKDFNKVGEEADLKIEF